MSRIDPTVSSNSLPYAVVFPGQGAQYPGMGQSLAEGYPAAEAVYAEAEQQTGLPIRQLSFEPSASGEQAGRLNETNNTQPCLLAASLAGWEAWRGLVPRPPAYALGHSAGEYAALAAAGVLSRSAAFRLIAERGRLMSQMKQGAMAAIKDADEAVIVRLLQEAVVPGGVLVPANRNSPSQTVVSGDVESIDALAELGFDQDITVIPLAVSGAFHSPLMEPAAREFAATLAQAVFEPSLIPVVSNVTARPEHGVSWRRLLQKQITAPVLWEASVRYVLEQGIKLFVEIGPGQVLSRLIRAVDPSAITLHVEDASSLKDAVDQIQIIFRKEFVV